MTTVEMTDKQARFFLLLAKAGAFDILNGSVEIHIDGRGNPVKAETKQYTHLDPSIPQLTVVL